MPDTLLATVHLDRAAHLAFDQDLTAFREHLARRELALAAGLLVDLGKQHERRTRAYWEALALAYEALCRAKEAKLCRMRIYEAEHGYVEATLSLLPASQGGRASVIRNEYRPDWDIGNLTESGERELNSAHLVLEDCSELTSGESATVRLHPTWRHRWTHVCPGAVLSLYEDSRLLGTASVLRVTLRGEEPSA